MESLFQECCGGVILAPGKEIQDGDGIGNGKPMEKELSEDMLRLAANQKECVSSRIQRLAFQRPRDLPLSFQNSNQNSTFSLENSSKAELGAAVDLKDGQVESSEGPTKCRSSPSLKSKTTAAEVCGHWLVDPRVFWRHPWARIFIASMILVIDMFLFAEDPVNDSHVECNLPGLGHLLCLFVKWTGSPTSMVARLVLIVCSVLFGCVFGTKVLHHRLLRDRFGLSMFTDYKGTWFAMGLSVVPSLFVGIMLHNLMFPDDEISSATGMKMNDFSKSAQCCSVTADLVAIIMVIDGVLQEESGPEEQKRYPDWIPSTRKFYSFGCNGFFRIIVVWLVAISAVVLFAWGILNTGKEDGDWRWDNRAMGGLTDVTRAFLVLCVIFCDLFTVMQDWEFPTFSSSISLDARPMIAGVWVHELNCGSVAWLVSQFPPWPKCLSRFASVLPDANYFLIKVSGPWLSYGPLLCVILLDLFCMRTQFIYEPSAYGQYVHPSTTRIWTIVDEEYLSLAYEKGVLKNREMVTYEARWNITTGEPLSASAATDTELNSRYLGSSLKFVAIIPAFTLILVFWVLVFLGNLTRKQAEPLLKWKENVRLTVRDSLNFSSNIHEPTCDRA